MYHPNRRGDPFDGHICGCYYTVPGYPYGFQRHYLPQVELSSHTTITPLSFSTHLSQSFANTNSDPVPETRYTFPLYDGVAVTSFTCTIGDKVMKGHVEQKEQARQTYNKAIAKGETAGLLESLPFGIFGVTLGNIPAKATINVDITYGGELKHDAEIDGLRYILPTSIAPRYGSYPGELQEPDTAIAKGMRITVDINMYGSLIRKVQSPSKGHPIGLDLGCLSADSQEAAFDPSKACATLAHDTTELGEDFILQILVDNISSPRAIFEPHSTLPNRQALMTTFVPKFDLKPINPEIVFIADQSGSMRGKKNDALVAALKTFLKSLPIGVRFNICTFGNSHSFLWEKSMPYNQDTTSQALAFVSTLTASMGGTEMFRPVRDTFQRHLGDLPLEIILLTDGEIYAEGQLFDYITEQIHVKKVDARCFVLGVGGDVSHTLVEGIARAGNGVCQFVTTDEVMDSKVIRMLRATLYPHVKDYTLEVEYEDESDDISIVSATPTPSSATTLSATSSKTPISLFDTSADLNWAPSKGNNNADRYAHLPTIPVPSVIQAPHNIPPLLPFSRTTVHLLLEHNDQVPKSVILRGTCSQGPLELRIPVQKLNSTDNVINSLAAKKACQDLEEGRGWLMDAKIDNLLVKEKYPSRFDEIVEREVVRLGVDYQVANKWCSFVAVENKHKKIDDSLDKEVSKPDPDDELEDETGFMIAPDEHGPSPAVIPSARASTVRASAPRVDEEESDDDMGFSLFDGGPPPRQASRMIGGGGGAPIGGARGGPGGTFRERGGGFASNMAALQMRPVGRPPTTSARYKVASSSPHMSQMRQRQQQQQPYARPTAPAHAFGLARRRMVRSAQPSIPGGTLFGNAIHSSEVPSPEMEPASPQPQVIPTSSTLATIRALIDLQNFDGSWDSSDILLDFFKNQGLKNILSPISKEVATVLVIAWMEKKVGKNEKDVCEMVVEKAKLWLEMNTDAAGGLLKMWGGVVEKEMV